MKNSLYLIIALISLLFFSCQFTEEITFNKNGSGAYNLTIDMGPMMQSMSGMSSNDSIKKEPEKIDSIIYFKDILEIKKDSIAKLSDSDKALLEAMKGIKMKIHLDESKNEMTMQYMMDFKDIGQIDDIQKKIEKAQQLQDNKGENETTVNNHKISFSYSKNKFVRKVTMLDLSEEEQATFDKNQEQFSMFMTGSVFKLIYNFPRKIKKVTYPDVKFSDNKKTLIIEVPMDTLNKNPKLLDFEVDF